MERNEFLCSRTHLQHFRSETLCGYDRRTKRIYPFDEVRNIREVSALGVHCIYVGEELTADLMHESLSKFAAAGRIIDQD
jgi:hypothetical protein